MNKSTPFIFSALFLAAKTCKQNQIADYADGNGTIIHTETKENHTYTIRRHEQELIIGNQLSQTQRIIHSNFFSKNTIGTLQDNDTICIHQILEDFNQQTNSLYIWYNFSFKENQNCWIFLGKAGEETLFPYHNNNWAITQKMQTDSALWAVRKLEQKMALWDTTALFYEPGEYKKLSGTLKINGSPEVVQTKAIALNQDFCSEWWVKISINGVEAWVIDSNALTAERMGPKFLTPEAIVEWELGWY